ncbi:MAG: tol-pal system protein YbgF [candidate division KSB1 bacterium]|nr:tol-pal system protein YbgF [candidate division KSB1 bacterium]
MRSKHLASIICSLSLLVLIFAGCATTKQESTVQGQPAGSELDQILGASEEGQKQEAADEAEVLRLLGIAKEKAEPEPAPQPTSTDDQLKKDIAELERRLAEKDAEIARLRSDLEAAKEEKTSKIESSSERQPSVATKTEISTTFTGDLRQDYQNALSEYYNRNYKLAIQLFEELLARYPNTSLSDNCRYWIGESYYALGNFNQAIIEFTKVFSFANSNKLDDAQLKLGLCYLRLGDRERARQEFERLISDYPNSEYVTKAQQYLSKL